MNAVIYARYSCHSQTEQSIEGQLRDCYEYARRNELNIVGEYIDRAISGSTDDRPSFQRMIDDAPRRQFDRILVWKLDRFARNRYDSAMYKHRLKQYGVRVISVMENVGEGDESILLEALLEASAEYYSLDLRKKIKRGQRENIAKGRFCGGTIPYGYKSLDGKLVIDEEKAPVVRYVFEQYAAGVPMKRIIDALNRRGVRGSRGGKLHYNTFSRVLVNPCYIGKYRYNGETVPGLSQPMIDEETFERAQLMVARNGRAPAANKAIVRYMLQGKAFCGHCGANMVGECGRSRHGSTYHYYTCSARKKQHTCNKRNEKKTEIEQYVIRQTLEYVLSDAQADRIAKAIVAQYEKEFANSKSVELEKAIHQYERALDKLVDALIDAPKVAHQRIYEKMETIEAQKTVAENDLIKLRIAEDRRPSEADVRAWLKSFSSGDPSDPDFCQNIIETFVNSVYLFDDYIVILYNSQNNRTHTPTQTDLPVLPPLHPQSDSITKGSPKSNESDPYFFLIDMRFGFVFYRSHINKGQPDSFIRLCRI